MLLQPIVLVTMVPVLAAAAPGPVSNLINRGDKVKCHEFVHNPDRSTWNTSYSLPTQRISHWVDCKVGVNCTIKIVPGIRIGWKYYWDVPDGVTLDLGRYDPASKIGAGMNYVVTTSSSGDYFVSIHHKEDWVGALGCVGPTALRVPGTFKCDNGVEHAGMITLANGSWWGTAVLDSSDSRFLFSPHPPAPGGEASIMTLAEMEGHKDQMWEGWSGNGSRRSVVRRAWLVAVPLAVSCLSLTIL